MATAFTTGTINQPDAGSVGLAMAEKIRDDLVAHAAWELVEEYYPATGAVRWYVFRCLAAQSGLPADFYVIMGRTLGDGSLRFFISEGYNPATHVVTQYCVSNPSSTQFLYDSVGRVPVATNFTLGLTQIAATFPQPLFNSWTPSGTSTKWWLIAADDGFTVAFNGASNGAVHVGAYIPLTSLPITMPIHQFGLPSTNVDGHVTRNPAIANVNHYGGALQTSLSPNTGSGILGFYGPLAINDALQGGQRLVAERGIFTKNIFSDSVQIPIYGWAYGKVKRMRFNPTNPPAGFAFGDAYVLQGRLWVPYVATAEGHMWDTGVSA
jgi:hypothetical protein